MYLNQLRYFLTLSKLEHYTEAAEKLAITQPTLSHAISSLEKELGVPLFEKKGRNIILTKYGLQFSKSLEDLLQGLDAVITDLKLTGSGEGIIDLAFIQTLGTSFVPKLVNDFIQSNTGKKYRFQFFTGENATRPLLEKLKDSEYDLVFCSKVDDEPLIDFIPVAKQELIVAVPLDHPLTQKDAIRLEETLPYPQIAFHKTSGLRSVVDELFNKIGRNYKISYEIKDDQVIAGFVSHGFGIAVIPNMPFLETLNLKVLKLTHPDSTRLLYLATKKNTYLTPATKSFKQFVIKNSQL